ncbi:DUF1697 domain-containing protein [Virgibacillus flavescens]|uniref:DUF1697 domain-containing protein n=1 Tax=Virgibacillus flavescens TaxID=1611422 RepID=UPI003D32C8D8
MTTYIALLRAINLGKYNKVKMADLRSLLESLGLENVQTYIQSGNVIFDSTLNNEQLQKKLEEKMEAKFGFPIPVMLRTVSEFEEIVQKCPYESAKLLEGESVHVAFLSGLPLQEKINALTSYTNEVDEYQIKGTEIYIYFRQNLHKSKLPAQLKKLDVSATLRNWKTVMKLVSMGESRK